MKEAKEGSQKKPRKDVKEGRMPRQKGVGRKEGGRAERKYQCSKNKFGKTIHPSTHPSIHPSLSSHPSLSIHPSTHPPTHPSIYNTLSLTVITLTVGVIYTTVFEYQNQVIFNMTVFDGRPSLSN
jgi:hypothetical protein